MNPTPKNPGTSTATGASDPAERLSDKLQDGARQAKEAMHSLGAEARDVYDDAKDATADAVAEGRSRVEQAVRQAQDTAQGAKDAVVAGASSTMAAVRDAAVEKADVARESLSDVGQRLAETLERASAEGADDALKSRLLTSVAQGLTSASDALRERSVSDLSSDLRMLARRHPGAFMAAAALAGFAAARFLRSSARRRMAQDDSDHSPERRV